MDLSIHNLIIMFLTMAFLTWFALWSNDNDLDELQSPFFVFIIIVGPVIVSTALSSYLDRTAHEKQIHNKYQAEAIQQDSTNREALEAFETQLAAHKRAICTLQSEKRNVATRYADMSKRCTEYQAVNERLMDRVKQVEGAAYGPFAAQNAQTIQKQWNSILDVLARAGIRVNRLEDWTSTVEELCQRKQRQLTAATSKAVATSTDIEKAQNELTKERTAKEALQEQIKLLEQSVDEKRRAVKNLQRDLGAKSTLAADNELLRKNLAAAQSNEAATKERLDAEHQRSTALKDEEIRAQKAAAQNECTKKEVQENLVAEMKSKFAGELALQVNSQVEAQVSAQPASLKEAWNQNDRLRDQLAEAESAMAKAKKTVTAEQSRAAMFEGEVGTLSGQLEHERMEFRDEQRRTTATFNQQVAELQQEVEFYKNESAKRGDTLADWGLQGQQCNTQLNEETRNFINEYSGNDDSAEPGRCNFSNQEDGVGPGPAGYHNYSDNSGQGGDIAPSDLDDIPNRENNYGLPPAPDYNGPYDPNFSNPNYQAPSLPDVSDGYRPSLNRSQELPHVQGFDGLRDHDAFSGTTQPDPPGDGTAIQIGGEDDDTPSDDDDDDDDEPEFDPDNYVTDNEAADDGKHSQAKDANEDANDRINRCLEEAAKELEEEKRRQQEENERVQKQKRDRPIRALGQRQQERQVVRTLYD